MLNLFYKIKNEHRKLTFLVSLLMMILLAGIIYSIQQKIKHSTVSAKTQETVETKIETKNVAQASEEIIKENEAILTEDQSKSEIIVPVERNKNPKTRLDEAKMYTRPQILTGKYIDISLKYQNMVIFEDGNVLDAFIISSGKKGLDTPVGTFKIENKSPRAWSARYGLWMPNWMAILPSGEIGIHELPVWPGGYQEGANHLGSPVSHGCVRLGKSDAKKVYDWAEIGTVVIVHK